ncbi:MAG: hypothetical protein ACXVEF_14630 [Polyangiales bacterium]
MTTSWEAVVQGPLRGFTFGCPTPITILLDSDPVDARSGAIALRLLAGILPPASGRVLALGGDPMRDPALRRSIALLGDPALLEGAGDPLAMARELAAVRGVSLQANERTEVRALADAIANASRARLVLAAYPEDYLETEARKALFSELRSAIERSVPVVIATRSLDEVLALSPDDRALAGVIRDGVIVASAPAHALPWSLPWDASTTRLVRVVLAESDASPPPSARLAADLLADETVGASIAQAEPVSATELRLRTRDPRALARAIAARAKDGLDVRALTVIGATAAEMAGRS